MLLAVLVVTDNEFQIVGAALVKQQDSKSEDVRGRYRSPVSDDRKVHQFNSISQFVLCTVVSNTCFV